jgi:hypothetical protein
VNRLVLMAILLAAGPVVAGAAAATPKPKTLAAYQACLKAHGVVFGSSKPAPQAVTRAAFKACASQAPAGLRVGGGPTTTGGPRGFRLTGAQRAAFQQYQACMSNHGVTMKPGTRVDASSAKFKSADKACASLRPKLPGRPPATR